MFLVTLLILGGCHENNAKAATPEEESDQVGPGPGEGIPVRATYRLELCIDAPDGLVTFMLEPGTRIAMSAEICDGVSTGEICGIGAHVCCRPADYSVEMVTWPAELIETRDGAEANAQVVRVQCEDGDDYVRVTWLEGLGDPGGFS